MNRRLLALTLSVTLTFTSGRAAAQPRLEVRFGGLAQLGARNALLVGDVSAATGTLLGTELQARYRYVGMRVRVGGGAFTDSTGTSLGDLASGDLALQLGTPSFAVEAGISRRAVAGARGTIVSSAMRPGVAIGIPIGESGITVRFAPALLIPLGSAEPKMSGLDLETGLLWFPRRWPIYAQVGYRNEQFTLRSGTDERPEEMGSVLLGGGVRWSR